MVWLDVIKNGEAIATQTLAFYIVITTRSPSMNLKMQLYVKTQEDRNFHSMGTSSRNTMQNVKNYEVRRHREE